MRTTMNIDGPVLKELRRIQKEEKKSLGQIASELLAEAIGRRSGAQPRTAPILGWSSRPMQARIDLGDKDALERALDDDTV